MDLEQIQNELQTFAINTRKCADFYGEKPGLVNSQTITDLYDGLTRLAILAEQLARTIKS